MNRKYEPEELQRIYLLGADSMKGEACPFSKNTVRGKEWIKGRDEARDAAGEYKTTFPKREENCSNFDSHTVEPIGYFKRQEWRARKIKTHRLMRCPVCDRGILWIKRNLEPV